MTEYRPEPCPTCSGAGFIRADDGWRYSEKEIRCQECDGTGNGAGEQVLCCAVCETALIGSLCPNEDCGIGAALGPDDVRWIAEDDAQFVEAQMMEAAE